MFNSICRIGAVMLAVVLVATDGYGQVVFARAGAEPEPTSLLDRPAGLVVRDVSLDAALNRLAKSSQVVVAFSPSLIRSAQHTVTCDCSDVTVKAALDLLLTGTSFRYAVLDGQIVLTPAQPAVQLPRTLLAQGQRYGASSASLARPMGAVRGLDLEPGQLSRTGTITGIVQDAGTQRPIIGAQVFIQDTGIGTITDTRGRFILVNAPIGTQTVRVVLIGYATGEQTVVVRSGEAVTVNFSLTEQALALDRVVVTGQAGQARRREIGNTVAQIETAAIAEPALDLEGMLQGRAVGMSIGEVSAAAGSGSMIRLRGNNSVAMSNQPLVYIDGVRVRSEPYPKNAPPTGPSLRSGNVHASPLNDVNPNNIERIEIVKGAAATTLYGSEAAAGVIQIFTKKGATGAPQWTAQVDQGFSKLLPFAAYSKDFPAAGTTEPYMRLDPWLRNGHRQKYYLSARGGTQEVSYVVSGGWEGIEGVLPNEDEERLSLQANFRFFPMTNVLVDINNSLMKTSIQNMGSGQNVHSLIVNAYRGDRNNVGGYSKERLDPLLDYDIRTGITRTLTSASLTHTPREDFSHRFNVGFDRANSEMRQVRPFGFILAPNGIMSSESWVGEMLTLDYAANLSRPIISQLRATLSGGAQMIQDDTRSVRGYSENFPGPVDPTLGSGSNTLADEVRQKVISGGFFGQLRLEHRDRLFITGGVRVDGNSAFGERMGLEKYPKVSASYVLSDESFWQSAWGTLRLRAAYGQAGRAPGAFDAVRTWEPTRRINQPAFVPRNVGNEFLKAERTTELEFGLDASVLGDRLSIELTRYDATTSDALFFVGQIPSMGGWGSQLANVGKLENHGIELSLNGRLLQQRRFAVELGLGVATNHSNLVELGGATPFSVGGLGFIDEGYPVPVIRGRRLTNPRERAEPIVEADHYFGPNQPTLIVTPSARVRLPYGVTVSGRAEYQGGHYIFDGATSAGIQRGVPQPTCIEAHALMADGRRDELPANFRLLCDFALFNAQNYVFAADFFKVRDLTVQFPVGGFMPRTDDATFTISARNALRWFNSDWFAYDPEMGGQEGHRTLVRSLSEHAPAPASFVASLRVHF